MMKLMQTLSERNTDLLAKGPVTLAFLGDSVTHGVFELEENGQSFVGISDYGAVYHSRLKEWLQVLYPKAPINVINAGIGGDSAPGGAKRLERDVLRFQPDLCVVCFGLNDVHGGMEGWERYLSALREIFAALKARGIETIFLTPNRMNAYVSTNCGEVVRRIAEATARLQNDGVMDAYMDGARALCAEMGVPVCDGYARWQALHAAGVDTTRLLSNRINHPTREMHRMFASMLLEVILQTEEDGGR